jgi:tRNA1Val (adenine37-N6)-methyltransferase
MPNDYFQFKQFLVKQDRSAFKVGTDGVLLGAWAGMEHARSILDIGTGTGLIALMLAQRASTAIPGKDLRIVALEIDEASCDQARGNINSSPWPKCIQVINKSLQEYGSTEHHRFDLIVSNPPFFSNALKPQSLPKEISRHATRLNLQELAEGAENLLAPAGKFCTILPVEEAGRLQQSCKELGLHLCRICRVRPTIRQSVKRHLLEFRRSKTGTVEESEMAIETDRRHEYTHEYRDLTRDFYLAF